jgi:hypothetical protein
MPWIVGAALTAILAVLILGVMQMRAVATRTPSPEPGKLFVDSRPAGARVVIDGQARGVTPLRLTLSPGVHAMTLSTASDQKSDQHVVPLTITSGGDVSQYFELAPTAPAVPVVGKLSVTSDPAGARVQVDGRAPGTAPLVIADLTPGEHTVLVSAEGTSIQQKVSVEAGGATSVIVSLPAPSGPAAGWLMVSAPFDVQVFENNDLVGSGGTPKIMMTAGRHNLRIVSQSLGYEDTRHIEITPGKVAALRVEPPKVTVSANARPWADVIIDGETVGQTPLGNLAVAIGTHQVIFRHPQLGEQRQTMVVTAKGPNRISADMTKK